MRKIYSSLFFVILLQACVSNSKYRNAVAHIDKLKADSALLAKRNRMLGDEKSYLETKGASMEQILTQRLQEKQDSLNQKEEQLRQHELSINDMKARKAEEREAFETLTKSVFGLFGEFPATDVRKYTNCTQIVIEVSDRLLFTNGSTKVDAAKANIILNKVAEAFAKNADLNLMIVAHTDSVVSVKERFDDLWTLGSMKSNNILRQLVKEQKLNPLKISSASRAETIALIKQNSAIGKNRIEFVFYSSFLPCIHSKE